MKPLPKYTTSHDQQQIASTPFAHKINISWSILLDHYDIKMLTYLMVARLASLCPTAVLQRLDRLVEPLRTTCTTKVKANAVKQEYEKQDELKVVSLLTLDFLTSVVSILS